MSYYHLDEINGQNARESTTRLMKSLREILKESGADALIEEGRTLPPRPLPSVPADAPRAEAPAAPQPRTAEPPRAVLERPVCLSRPKKSLFARLFG